MSYDTVRDFWPEDPRWGEAYLPGPVGGVRDTKYFEDIRSRVAHAQAVVAEFEDKYPENHWWTVDFVEARPAVALLLQSVNDTNVFPSQASLRQLGDKVADQNIVPFINHSEALEVQVARLALSVMLQGPTEDWTLAHQIMTGGDKLELVMLVNGERRVQV